VLAGIDEAGRGPLAGPLVAGAVRLPPDADIPGVNDSKKLSDRRRRALLADILAVCESFGTGLVEPAEIDAMGMSLAGRTAFRRAADAAGPGIDLFLVDGLPVKGLGSGFMYFVKGDSSSLCIAAASILAKVTRDRIMIRAEAEYPGYGFAVNKGYGTPDHMEALARLGPSPIHRMSFSPLRDDPQMRLDL
jgi:ribonuclease HII